MDIYPKSPDGVPPNLTAPSGAYMLRIVAVMLSLLLFAGLYVSLVAGSAWLTYFIVVSGPLEVRYGFVVWIGGIVASVMLFAFLLKGIFKRRRMDRSAMVEIRAEDEPVLFEFIDQLCRDTHAPRPKRVYLTHEVNAAVFYDSSFLSMFLPVRKNLLIGLGLVNVLTLDELKAVLAHEFGHFSQSTMRLGSYVYVASSVMDDMIFGRDAWDEVLEQWKRTDIRLAVFGWILSGVVWALRGALKFVFLGIHLVNASLTRQMEFNADNVAVSVTGSDSLVHGLSRLVFADQCLHAGFGELAHAADHGHYTDNVFVHQASSGSYLRKRRRDPTLGVPPPLPSDPSATTQVFDGTEGNEAPNMWASHPPNHEREENAKQFYIRSVIDARPAWSLCRDPEAIQRTVTARLYETGVLKRGEQTSAREVQAFIDTEHAATEVGERWRSYYDDRVLSGEGLRPHLAEELDFEADPREEIERLLGSELDPHVESWRATNEEIQAVVGAAQSGASAFRFRGESRKRDDLEVVLETLNQERRSQKEDWLERDIAMLRAHRVLAQEVCPEREEALLDAYRLGASVEEVGERMQRGRMKVEEAINARAGRELSDDEFRQLIVDLVDGWSEIEQALEVADLTELPALPNLDEYDSVGAFLLAEDFVTRPSVATGILPDTLPKFFAQVGEVLDKQHRLSQKAVVYIARQQEQIQDHAPPLVDGAN
ncbi:MAG: M48 family metallopeptidase [Myxococcota bacterium]